MIDINNYTSANMSVANASFLHCCLHMAEHYTEIHNFTRDGFVTLARICYKPNYASSHHILSFVNDSRHLIHPGACEKYPLSVPISHCDLPTTSGNLGYVAFWVILMILIFATNVFCCMAILYSKQLLKNPSHRFILSLAVSDLLIGIVAVPMKIDYTLHNQTFCSSNSLCHLAFFVDHLVFMSAILILFAIGVDRYLSVSRPYKYQQLMNTTRANMVIASVWISSCIVGIMANVDWGNFSLEGVGVEYLNCVTRCPKYTGGVLLAGYFIPLITMGIIYYKIFRITLRHTVPITMGGFQDIEDANGSTNGSANGSDNRWNSRARHRASLISSRPARRNRFYSCFTANAKLRAMRVIVIVYGAFVITWLPGNIVTLINLFRPRTIVLEWWQFHIINEILPFSNSALNVFIYALMNEDCKRAMQKLMVCKFVQRHIRKKRFNRESQRRESTKSITFSTHSSEL
eukprot:Seg2792.1 transcript_id=Seg2792.1/GoldUCD/mRNA.D3Y31 product="Adenosine receptor A2a" protein_id=Seg2792.1/GoldUCD/D3Y31